jgi:phosphotransferase system IIB component
MEITNNINVDNSQLEKAIELMQADNCKENVDAMVHAAMKTKFITLAKVHAPENVAKNHGGKTVMQQQSQVQFQLIQNADKEQYFPAFTSLDELNRWKGHNPDAKPIIMTFQDFAQVLANPQGPLGFVINPFGKSVAFPRQMAINLFQQHQAKTTGLHQRQFNPEEKLHFGEPEEYPIDMMAAIIGVLQERDDVNAAYLRLFKPESAEQPCYLVIVDFTGDMNEIFSVIGKAAAPHLDGMQLSMMPYSLEIAQKAIAGVEPFFTNEN